MLACLTFLSISACAAPAPVSSSCGWESMLWPDPGFETRWTHDEKLWAVEHNDKVSLACPELKP